LTTQVRPRGALPKKSTLPKHVTRVPFRPLLRKRSRTKLLRFQPKEFVLHTRRLQRRYAFQRVPLPTKCCLLSYMALFSFPKTPLIYVDCSRKPIKTKQPRNPALDLEFPEVSCDSDAQAGENAKLCSPHASCQNSKCVCNADAGFSGDGVVCEYIDPCANEELTAGEVCYSALRPESLGAVGSRTQSGSGRRGEAPRADRKCAKGFEKTPPDCKLGKLSTFHVHHGGMAGPLCNACLTYLTAPTLVHQQGKGRANAKRCRRASQQVAPKSLLFA
jgi:hypothetical protein